jgi:hypothetical protein
MLAAVRHDVGSWLEAVAPTGCKIADNTDPLRGIFAFKSDPF